MSDNKASLTISENSQDYAIMDGSVGPQVIDVRKLYANTGMFTYDPGFTSTASCESGLTYIDGDEGVLLHRGYPIGQLAEQSSFMEVCYLLLNGELPSKAELEDFTTTITRHTMVHEQLTTFFRGFRRDAHPMAIMVGVVGALSAFYHDSTDINDPAQRRIASHRLIAKMPTIAAMAYKYSVGQPFVYPRNDLSYTANFLRMTFSVPAEEYVVDPVVVDAMDFSDVEHRNVSFNRLVAKLPTIVAMAYKYNTGQPFMYPRNDLSYTANFMHMMFGTPCETYEPNPVLVHALDTIFTLHADHEQNASTSTVRLAGSSGANPFACISAGIACLWGPSHGGANEACLQMLEEIGDVSKVGEYINRAKDKNDSFKLMGFGHRVYKNFDPRAKLMRKVCYDVLKELGLENDRLFKLAMELEKIALEDPYFVEKKLYPNVDFYSGIVQKALGIPTDMFTCIFALARTVGWMTQWEEMITDPEYKIGRPRQLYTGAARRDVKPLEKRG